MNYFMTLKDVWKQADEQLKYVKHDRNGNPVNSRDYGMEVWE